MNEKDVMNAACNMMVQACLGLLVTSGNLEDSELAEGLRAKAKDAEIVDTGQLTLEEARGIAQAIIETV